MLEMALRPRGFSAALQLLRAWCVRYVAADSFQDLTTCQGTFGGDVRCQAWLVQPWVKRLELLRVAERETVIIPKTMNVAKPAISSCMPKSCESSQRVIASSGDIALFSCGVDRVSARRTPRSQLQEFVGDGNQELSGVPPLVSFH